MSAAAPVNANPSTPSIRSWTTRFPWHPPPPSARPQLSNPSKEKQERILPAPLLLTLYNPHQQNEGRFSITPSESLCLPTCQLDSIPAIRASSKPSPEAKYVRSPTPCLIQPTDPHPAPA